MATNNAQINGTPAVAGVSLIALAEQLATLQRELGITPASPVPVASPAPETPKPAASAPKKTRKAKPAAVATPETPHTLPAQARAVKVDAAADAYRSKVAFVHALVPLLVKAQTGKVKSRGVHSKYSGFNSACACKWFGAEDSDALANTYKVLGLMAERGDIQQHPCRGGYMVYLPGQMPVTSARRSGADILAELGL